MMKRPVFLVICLKFPLLATFCDSKRETNFREPFEPSEIFLIRQGVQNCASALINSSTKLARLYSGEHSCSKVVDYFDY